MKTAIIEGQYTLIESHQRYALAGSFPRRFWDIVTYEDEEELAAYLAGQQPFICDNVADRFSIPFGQEDRQDRRAPPEHTCARCARPCKAQYRYCYRCHSYLKVKEKKY